MRDNVKREQHFQYNIFIYIVRVFIRNPCKIILNFFNLFNKQNHAMLQIQQSHWLFSRFSRRISFYFVFLFFILQHCFFECIKSFRIIILLELNKVEEEQ